MLGDDDAGRAAGLDRSAGRVYGASAPWHPGIGTASTQSVGALWTSLTLELAKSAQLESMVRGSTRQRSRLRYGQELKPGVRLILGYCASPRPPAWSDRPTLGRRYAPAGSQRVPNTVTFRWRDDTIESTVDDPCRHCKGCPLLVHLPHALAYLSQAYNPRELCKSDLLRISI